MSTAKISIAIDEDQLRRVRKAAESEGLSVSRYIARALSNQLEDHRRLEAARALYESWGESSVATAREREEFLRKLTRRRARRARAA